MVDYAKLFLKCKTDKEDARHKYGNIYSFVISSLVAKAQRKLNVLEIGMWEGDSLCAWGQSGDFDKIVAVDIDDKIRPENRQQIAGYNCDIHIRNAYDTETVNFLKEKYGSFDLIVDDGSHFIGHQLFFLEKYHDLLSGGGVLICEDVFLVNVPEITRRADLNPYVIDLLQNETFKAPQFNDSILVLRIK